MQYMKLDGDTSIIDTSPSIEEGYLWFTQPAARFVPCNLSLIPG